MFADTLADGASQVGLGKTKEDNIITTHTDESDVELSNLNSGLTVNLRDPVSEEVVDDLNELETVSHTARNTKQDTAGCVHGQDKENTRTATGTAWGI